MRGAFGRTPTWVWSAQSPTPSLPSETDLRLILPRPAQLRIGLGDWRQTRDLETRDLGPGFQGARLGAAGLAGQCALTLTWRWCEDGQWLGKDYRVRIG